MKKTPLIFAALVFAAAAQASRSRIDRPHSFCRRGIKFSPTTNRLAFTKFVLFHRGAGAGKPDARQAFARARRMVQNETFPDAGDGAAQLRPLLDDLLKSEWVWKCATRQTARREYALAIRLNDERAQLWSKNLAALLQSWTGIEISQDRPGIWWLKKHQPPNLLQFSRSGSWIVIDCGQANCRCAKKFLSRF